MLFLVLHPSFIQLKADMIGLFGFNRLGDLIHAVL